MPDMSGFGSSKDVRSCECKTSLLEMRGTSLSLSTCRGIVHSLVTPWTRSAESLYVILSLLEPEEAFDQGADHCFPTFITNQALSLEDYLGGRQEKTRLDSVDRFRFVCSCGRQGCALYLGWITTLNRPSMRADARVEYVD
jgi:hypothetical protein